MFRKTLFVLASAVAAVALVTYAVVGETGPIGWLDALQSMLVGSYSRKLSFLVLMVPALVAGFGLFLLLWPSGLAVLATPPEQTKPASYATAAILALALGVPLSWGASYGVAWWQSRSHDADAAATYEVLDLAALAVRAPAGATHFALRGRPLPDRVAEKSEGSRTIETLLPMVAPAWRDGDPVRFLIRLPGAGEGGPRALTREADGTVRVKLDGGVAPAARPLFARMNAPLAEGAIVLAPVSASEIGVAADAAAIDTGQVVFFGSAGSAVAVLFAILCGAAAFRGRREGRAASAAA